MFNQLLLKKLILYLLTFQHTAAGFYTVHLDRYSLINGTDELGPSLITSGSNLQGEQSHNVP